MSRALRILFCFLSLLLVLTNCKKNKWDEYYGRPSDLAQPMYNVLKAKGNFSKFLQCVDSSKFSSTIKGQGFYTLFAPTDSAFDVFLSENQYGTVDEFIANHPDLVEQVVSGALVYNAFTFSTLTDYQSSKTGWVIDEAFKRRTAYFKGVYSDDRYKYKAELSAEKNPFGFLIIDCNRNDIDATKDVLKNDGFEINDNSYKFIPYFFEKYVEKLTLTKPDFDCSKIFGRSYTKKIVGGANIIQQDVPAENGYIHVVDKVILPYKNLDEYLSSTSDFSMFKSLLDTFALFTESDEKETRISRINLANTGKKVYIKRYDTDKYKTLYPFPKPSLFSRLSFSPNNESWIKGEDNDAQINGWTLFVPTNAAMTDFYENQLLKTDGTRYSSLSQVPIPVIADFINAHMIAQTVWPEKISSTSNTFSETVDATKVSDYKMASNGMLYVLDHVVQTKRLYSVFGDVYLNPNMSMYFYQITNQSLHSTLSNINENFILLLNSNNLFRFFEFEWNYNKNTYSNIPNDSKQLYELTSRMDAFIRLNTLYADPSKRTDPYNLFAHDERIYKTLDENYVICKKSEGLANGSSVIFSAGNTDSVSLAGDTWAVQVQNEHRVLNGATYEVKSPPSTLNPSTLGGIWCMLKPCEEECGNTIKKYFYDNIYAKLEKGKPYYNSRFTSKDGSNTYCNTYYPKLSFLKSIDTLYFAYLQKSGLYSTSGVVAGLGSSGSACRTVLIPCGDSIAKYIDLDDTINYPKKLLPQLYTKTVNALGVTTVLPASLTDSDVRRIAAFIQYHIISRGVVEDNTTDPAENYETLLLNTNYAIVSKNSSFSLPGFRTIQVSENVEGQSLWDSNSSGSLEFKDKLNRLVKIIPRNSHILGERIVIHQINGILHY